MSKYRGRLPQLESNLFMTDGGLETTLVFHDGMELPAFAAFPLLRSRAGVERLRAYFERYIAIARRHARGIVLETPTWRANADWGTRLGYDAAALDEANRGGVALLESLRQRHEDVRMPVVISGCIGPRGDGYRVGEGMSVQQACEYHVVQIRTFAATRADLVTAFTLNYVEEAIGIAVAARAAAMPVVLSFTLETDGRLPCGMRLCDAIQQTDAATDGYPAYYMINCAHPAHFQSVLQEEGAWRARLQGIRANASRRSHAELDQSTDLDAGDPIELGRQYRELRERLPRLTVVGGCCGTDHRHVEAICRALEEQPQPA